MVALAVESLEYDVVVIGAGGAGLRAAIEAASYGAKTAVICKSLLGKAATVLAQGGIAAALGNVDSRDGWRSHFSDTVKAGKHFGNWRMAEIHAREAAAAVAELESWGALFDRTGKGSIAQRQTAGHRFARLAHRSDRTGLDMLRALQNRATLAGVDVHMECSIQRLMMHGSRISGALGYRLADGRPVLFRCKAVILASGGAGRAWEVTSNPTESTGDAFRLALEAGAELMDMEFVQFHPTGIAWPYASRGVIVSEVARCLGAILRNANGRRFMMDYVPDYMKSEIAMSETESRSWHKGEDGCRRPAELLPADAVALAIDAEVRAGRGTVHGGVWLHMERGSAYERIKNELPALRSQLRTLTDFDLACAPIEVAPTSHYLMGGVRVHPESAETRVPGLFAAGEAAAGLHGASRLAGNALSEALVFGRRAGAHAAQYAHSTLGLQPVSNIDLLPWSNALYAPLGRKEGEAPHVLLRDLQHCMQSFVGVSRTGEDLKRARVLIGKLRERLTRAKVGGTAAYNPEWHLSLALNSLLCASEVIVVSALERKETRGSHARRDYPVADPILEGLNVAVSGTAQGLSISLVAASEMPDELKRLVDWSKRWLSKKPGSKSGVETRAAGNSRNTG